MTHIWNNHGKFWVECVVHFANGSFVTPEGVVVLTVLGIWVADRGEHLVPRCGVGVRLWHAVWWLPANKNTGAFVNWCSGIAQPYYSRKTYRCCCCLSALYIFLCLFVSNSLIMKNCLFGWQQIIHPDRKENKCTQMPQLLTGEKKHRHKRFWSILNNNYSNK